MPDKSKRREEGFALVQFEGTICYGGEGTAAGAHIAAHVALTVRKQRRMDAGPQLTFSFDAV